MKHVILLISDEPDQRIVQVPSENPFIWLRDWILDEKTTFPKETECHTLRNNAIDRAKMLIRYVRNGLGLERGQVTLVRSSQLQNDAEILKTLQRLFRKYEKADILLYYCGHGLGTEKSGKSKKPKRIPTGWSLGENKVLYYRDLRRLLTRFHGTLTLINDCCYGLSIHQHLRWLPGKCLLLGASRNGYVASESILDPVLRYWIRRMAAAPVVAHVGRISGDIIDIPACAVRGTYYRCGCGSVIKHLKTFSPATAPSLRRGAELDHLWFPETPLHPA